MGWNDSGKGDKDNDPWGNGGKQQPPDLDEILKKIQQKWAGVFRSGKGRGAGKDKNNGAGRLNMIGIAAILVVFLVIWFLAGFFIVKPAEQAVILQFGKYVKTVDPGLHWIPRIIRSKEIINVEKIDNFSYSAQMLNKDENIVLVSMAVQYRINNPENFLFNVVNPVESLQQATASSLRQVVGHTTLDEVLTTGREKVRQDVSTLLKQVLERYNIGIMITDVAMLPARAPDEVKEAFDDAIKAQEDEQRFVNQAQAYVASVIPIAHGQASRIFEEAKAYEERTVLAAQGESSRFLAILTEYNKAPGVTRDRLYLDALKDVYHGSNKILVDVPEGNNLLYLPLDRMGLPVSPSSTTPVDINTDGYSSSNTRYPEVSSQRQNVRPSRDSYVGRGGTQ